MAPVLPAGAAASTHACPIYHQAAIGGPGLVQVQRAGELLENITLGRSGLFQAGEALSKPGQGTLRIAAAAADSPEPGKR